MGLAIHAVILVLLASGLTAQAQQAVEVTEPTNSAPAPEVGRDAAARKYFNIRRKADESAPTPERTPAAAGGERYMDLQIGTFLNEDVYKWGNGRMKDVGQLNVGVSYKVGEWTNSMDLMFNVDITTYNLDEGSATKMSLVPAITFPDVNSGFPLYFGAGAGLGIFFKQIKNESSLAFDYTLMAGARFFDVIQNVGFSIEAGLKNHILLLSDGQYNGVYINLGTVFRF